MDDDTTTQTIDETQLAEIAAAETPAPVKKVDLPETPVFGKYTSTGIEVSDVGLARYINLEAIGIMHHGARHGNKRFAKSKVHVVERLINDIMRTETYQGKKSKAYKAVELAFARVQDRAKENPVQVLVTAIVNAAPREEVTRLRYGGINVPKSVDVAPMRRLDLALRNLAMGATQTSFKSTKPISQCLADEIMKAAKNDPQSFAVAKRDELERVAKSAR
ncbi:MAG: small subunit ribosomal protein [Thermoplasmata archaeon]|jgi:small subunit ribosomal protein S7|nr:small subunit ribosomal protein [Thermoplasmata archaeon]